eukprot:COSAG05_NODE_1045_length_6054_cov_5.306969_4_plen_304_part_00
MPGVGCAQIPDQGHHAEPKKGCSFDLLAGMVWFQRQKQYLLANGIAVMVVNTRLFDGWNLDVEWWHRGEDAPFFEALAAEIRSGVFGPIDPGKVAFHGWSGGAQMVSNMAGVWGAGLLPGLEMKAGVMMSGGSQQCYNDPPNATAQCSTCDPSGSCKTPGCSLDHPDGPDAPICCEMCCPVGETESWYGDNLDEYARHPHMFLGQVEVDDVQADGCAARYYHEAMQNHSAVSELHLIPYELQRCFSIGQPQDPAVATASQGMDKWGTFCSSLGIHSINSMNHTTGSAEMVEPLARFLIKALKH